jgi:hypothetical protein
VGAGPSHPARFFARGGQIKIKDSDGFDIKGFSFPKVKKSKFSALTPATLRARTILSAATIDPLSLARVASKSKCDQFSFRGGIIGRSLGVRILAVLFRKAALILRQKILIDMR